MRLPFSKKPEPPAEEPLPNPPAPRDNLGDILQRRPWLQVKPTGKAFFLVNAIAALKAGRIQNQEYATNNAEPCVAIEWWDESFRELPIFRDAARIWVVLDPHEDNRLFLVSIAHDRWLCERSLITAGSMLAVTKDKHDSGATAVDDYPVDFDKTWNFRSVPLARDKEAIERLLKKPSSPESPSPIGGYSAAESWRVGGTGATTSARPVNIPIVRVSQKETPQFEEDPAANVNDGNASHLRRNDVESFCESC